MHIRTSVAPSGRSVSIPVIAVCGGIRNEPSESEELPAPSSRGIALVSGASRGIGKSIAVNLAAVGWDVALTARSLRAGEAREHSSTLDRSDSTPLPGSLEETAELVSLAGQRAMIVPADLLDEASLAAAVALVLAQWGRIDLLVNNGRYIGPGHMDHFVDTPIELLRRQFQANVMSPLLLTSLVLPSMLEHGGGMVVNITSEVAYLDPPGPAGAGGWGLGYAMSKGALHRMAGVLAVELGERGIRAMNVEPGFIVTERTALDMARFGLDLTAGAPPAVVGVVVAWLCSERGVAVLNGSTIKAQDVCRDEGLLPGWPDGS